MCEKFLTQEETPVQKNCTQTAWRGWGRDPGHLSLSADEGVFPFIHVPAPQARDPQTQCSAVTSYMAERSPNTAVDRLGAGARGAAGASSEGGYHLDTLEINLEGTLVA